MITATGRGPAERAELRTRLTALRLAELREGVWLRPANLDRPLPAGLHQVAPHVHRAPRRAPARPGRPALAARGWAATARSLLARATRADHPADRFTAYAAAVRHLLTDPVLPSELLPADWPGETLRTAYAGYRQELGAALGVREEEYSNRAE